MQVAVGTSEPVVKPLLTALLMKQMIASRHKDYFVLVFKALKANGTVLKLTEDLRMLVLLK